MLETQIAGYDFGRVPHSPLTLTELHQLEAALEFGEPDRQALHRASDLIADHAEEFVDGWREIIGAHEFLAQWFFGPDHKPDEHYKAAVKKRFVRWVIDVATRPFDQAWLDYQQEIGLRHTPDKKNVTDHTQTPPVVPLRYLFAFVAPVALTVRPQLQKSGVAPQDIDRIEAAWIKAAVLTVTLWSAPYTKEGLW
ncbi:MAG TPA: protoglobin domain-containing protein [Pseudolabrys sp.]|nr:protoglobin domain-containing protein [Pseudolabrys sp.]